MAIKGFSLRIDDTLLKKLHKAAKQERRSANSQIIILIQQYVDAYEKTH